MSALLAALSFLTLFPARRPADVPQSAISNSRAWFPLVGLFLGLALVGIEWGARLVFPVYLTAALLTAFLIIITRGLHLDGFMDTCDGLFGGQTPERRREIMRDSHVGAFAVVGVLGLLILKYGALLSLLSLNVPGKEWVLLLFPVFSRWTMVLLLRIFPYSRARGLGASFHLGNNGIATIAAAIMATAAAILLGGAGGAVILVGVSLLALLLGQGMAKMLGGGLTGDTYGATNEMAEVAVLLAAAVMLPYGLIIPLHLTPLPG